MNFPNKVSIFFQFFQIIYSYQISAYFFFFFSNYVFSSIFFFCFPLVNSGGGHETQYGCSANSRLARYIFICLFFFACFAFASVAVVKLPFLSKQLILSFKQAKNVKKEKKIIIATNGVQASSRRER